MRPIKPKNNTAKKSRNNIKKIFRSPYVIVGSVLVEFEH